MEWFKSISDGKGGFDTFKWNLGDIGMSVIVNILGVFIAGIIFGMAIPLIFLFWYPMNNDEDRLTGIIGTLILVIYLFVDYSQGWIMTYAFTDNGLQEVQLWLLSFNLGLLLLNGVMFLFNGLVGRMQPGLFYLFVIVTTYFFWFPLASFIVR